MHRSPLRAARHSPQWLVCYRLLFAHCVFNPGQKPTRIKKKILRPGQSQPRSARAGRCMFHVHSSWTWRTAPFPSLPQPVLALPFDRPGRTRAWPRPKLPHWGLHRPPCTCNSRCCVSRAFCSAAPRLARWSARSLGWPARSAWAGDRPTRLMPEQQPHPPPPVPGRRTPRRAGRGPISGLAARSAEGGPPVAEWSMGRISRYGQVGRGKFFFPFFFSLFFSFSVKHIARFSTLGSGVSAWHCLPRTRQSARALIETKHIPEI